MKLSSCDIGNPIYKMTKQTKEVYGRLNDVPIYLENGDEVLADLTYVYMEVPDGIDIEVDVDLSNAYILTEDFPALQDDIIQALEVLGKRINKISIF